MAFSFAFVIMLSVSIVATLLQQNGVDVTQGVAFWLVNGVYSLCLGAVGLLILKLTKQPAIQALGINKQAFSISKCLVLCATVVVLLNVSAVVNHWFLAFLTKLGCQITTKPITNEQILQNPVLAVLVACILPAINEEIIFRGLVAQGLSRKLGNVASVILTGLLFAVFHGSPAQMLHQFALGSLLAYVAISTQSVVLPVIAHFVNNLSAMLFALYVEPTGFYQTYATWIVAIGVAIIALLGFVCNRQFKLPQIAKEKFNSSAFDLMIVASAGLSVYLWVTAL